MSDENQKHCVNLEQRENIFISGVNDVISFNEDMIVIDTKMGVLVIGGQNLHVNKLNLDDGELSVDGEINSLSYENESGFNKNKTSFFSKIFK